MHYLQGIVEYFRSAKAELQKVSWPTRRDTIRYSTLVIAATAVLALFFAGLDVALQTTVEAVLTNRAPTGAAPSSGPIVPDLNPASVEVEVDGQPGTVQIENKPTP